MPTDEVTDADKHASVRLAYTLGLTAEEFTSGAADILVKAMRDHRTTSEQRDYDRAIGEVVAWLRERMKVVKGGEGGVIGTTMALCANAIEAGGHKP